MIVSKLPQVGTTIFTVMSRMAAECGAINLSQGFPEFSPPKRMLDLVSRHMSDGANQYAPMAGDPGLRDAISRKVKRLYGGSYDPEKEITVTAGATQAIFTAIAACVHPGDEVILFPPVYDSYLPAVLLAGGKPVCVPLSFPGYRPDWQKTADRITPRTRMILLNTPHNPTGTAWKESDLQALHAVVQGTSVLLLADEVYEHVLYDSRPHQSLARFPELRERSFLVSSFGKTYHMTGWKIGYCLAPGELMSEFRKVHQFNVFAVNHPMQRAIADFMAEVPDFETGLSAFYQAKRDFFRAQLEGTPFTLMPCEGTYFQLAGYEKISGMADRDFVVELTRRYGVAAIPVSAFHPGGEDRRQIRFCFAKNESTLAAAAARLRAVSAPFPLEKTS